MLTINSTINNTFLDWVAPMANVLAVSMGVNIDVMEVGDHFFSKIVEETSNKRLTLTNSIQDSLT